MNESFLSMFFSTLTFNEGWLCTFCICVKRTKLVDYYVRRDIIQKKISECEMYE